MNLNYELKPSFDPAKFSDEEFLHVIEDMQNIRKKIDTVLSEIEANSFEVFLWKDNLNYIFFQYYKSDSKTTIKIKDIVLHLDLSERLSVCDDNEDNFAYMFPLSTFIEIENNELVYRKY